VKALLAGNDNMAIGAVSAVRAAGKAGKVLVVGYDNINAIKPMLKDGRVLATADQYAAKQAVFGIDTALKISEHKKQSDLSGVVETPCRSGHEVSIARSARGRPYAGLRRRRFVLNA
jgi:ribose transport system substrate-binding protein